MTLAPDVPDTLVLRRLDRSGIQRFLPTLSAWLLPQAGYGVQHTWPQLYRSDGSGTFLALVAGDHLAAHCAFRPVTVHGGRGAFRAALLGSVATAPERRGAGLAGRLLRRALDEAGAQGAQAVLLWAERPDLYARAGFAAGPTETCALIARRPHPDRTGVRLAEVRDHAALHALHERKPWRVERSRSAMSALLTTPGMWTVVRERDGAIVAYACCGKGADLQGFWHEVGGSDAEVAALLGAAMALLEQTEARLLVPPYRCELLDRLGRALVDRATVSGPMLHALGGAGPGPFWIDGLDSV